MRKCGAMPYEGNEKYIFVSYCHRDSADADFELENLNAFEKYNVDLLEEYDK